MTTERAHFNVNFFALKIFENSLQVEKDVPFLLKIRNLFEILYAEATCVYFAESIRAGRGSSTLHATSLWNSHERMECLHVLYCCISGGGDASADNRSQQSKDSPFRGARVF